MNRIPDSDRDEREWQAQERALQQERQGAPAAHDDAAAARYRPVARVLLEPLPDALPADFAVQVAALARRQQARTADMDLRLERNLMRGLGAALVLGGAVALALYGQVSWDAFANVVPSTRDTGASWWLPALLCVGLSWGMDGVRKLASRRDPLRPA